MNTKKSLYRLLKIIDLIIIFVFAFGSPIGTLATVWTDQSDYSPGSVVTISGDNSNGIGYQPTEIVHVDVVGPNGYTAACEGVAADDANAAWSCQVTLWDSLDAVGTYTYTSLGLTSLVTETGTFTDAVGDFSIDFVAAAPYSYNHLVGGGAFDDRTVGKNADIVESLEAVDFACGDIVTFLAQIVVDDTERAGTDAPQTIELDFEFLMDTTGASGVAIGDITYVGINYAPIVDLIAGEDNIDQGNKDDGGSVATLIYENQTGPMFTPKSVLQGTVQITDLERNEEVIVRVDTRLYCQPGSDPTGNLQGAITAGRLTYIKGNVPVTPPANISVGNQTVPFLQFGNLQWPDIDIQKTVTSAGGTCPGGESLDIASGDTVKYCYVVSNTGTASMYDVTSVTDDNRTPGDTSDDFTVTLTGLTDVDGDGQMDDLAAGGTAYGEALVTVTAASTGTYTNVGTVSGFTFPNDTTQPLTDSDTASVVVTFVPMPAISIVKTTNGSDGPTILIGQPVNWDYLVTNTGNVELTNVSVTDDQGVTVTCPQTTLAVGASMTCTASGTAVTGNYSNIGTASGDYGGMSYTASDPSSYFGADPKIDIQKTPDTQTVIYGQTANFTIVVTNIGNVPLTNVTVSDPLAPNCDATIGDLAVGASSSYNCSLANVTASFTNVATASGDYGTTTVTDNDDAAVVVDLLPDISVTKTGNPTSVPETGGNVTFTYVVTNNSSEDATIIALSDDKFGTLAGDADCAVGTVLAGGASCTFDATFAIPAGDYPGSHVNVFSATAQDPQGNTDTATDDETITYTDVLPDISVTKTGVPTSIPETGGSVTFTYVVTNNSSEDATITDLSDDKFGLLAGDTDCQVGTVLAAGASCSFEATFSIPAGDYPGSHINVFTATAADDDGNSDTATDDETITYTDVAPAISIIKTADPTHVPETGGDVTITFVVSNVGVEDVTLTSLTDTVFGDLNGQGNCVTGGLIPVGGSYTCSITVNLSSDSLTAHTNVVTAVGTDDDGTTDTATDDETVTFDDVAPDITITKTASPTLVPETGGDVTFTFLVENIGVEDVTLTSLLDDVFGDLNGQGDCVTGGLIPVGGSYSCSITRFLSSDSLTPHTNVVTAIGTDDDGTSDTATDDETVTFDDVAPDVSITKTASPTHVPETGGDVTFTFLVENIGVEDVTLTSLTDTVFGDLNGQGDCVTGGLIPVGGSYTCSITVFLSSDSLTPHTNIVTAVGTDDDGTSDTATDDETVTFDDVAPDITITKTADPTHVPETGGDVTFTFVVSNIGVEDVTLTSLNDTVFGDLNGQGDCVTGGLIPVGGSYSCSITRFLSSDSLTPHTNVVTAIGTDDDGTADTATDDETVTFTDVPPEITINKTAYFEGVTPAVVPETGGDVIFNFYVYNGGPEDVTLNSLVDDIFGDLTAYEGTTCFLPQAIAINGSYSCSITVFLASDSLSAHTNVVTATAVDDENTPATADADETVTFTNVAPMIRITKTADPTHVPETGGDVTFTFLVENIGQEDVTLTELTDTVFGDLSGQGTCAVPQTILIGGSYSCSITVFLSSDSLTAHYNVVQATAVDDDGTQAFDNDDETVTFDDVAPAIRITKTADPTHVPETGGNVTFTFLVENIGQEDVTLTLLSDTIFGNLNGQGTCVVPQTILIGGSYSCSITVFLSSDSLTAHYNVVQATAVDDDGTQAFDNDDETVTFDDVAPDITITKTASPTLVPETGGDVTFTFLVENIGVEDVTLTSLSDSVFGDLNGQGDCVTGGLIPVGGSYTCSITVFLSSDSLTPHTNVVTAVGTDDDGTSDTATDDETISFTDVAPLINVTKWSNPTSVPETGANVTFTFRVDNTGQEDVTLTSLVDTVFGDLDGKGTCDLPQTILIGGSYSCEYTVFLASDSLTAHTNVVTGTAVDDDGTQVTDDDDATVTFTDVAPEIRITKTADPTHVPETGGDVTFTFLVENIGQEDVTLTELTDTVFSDLNGQGTCAVPQTILIGGSYSCSITVWLEADDLVAHYNVSTATAVDDDGTSDTATDDETVTFDDVAPDISITKTADPTHVPETGGDVTFTFLVENIGVEDVTLTSLVDDVFGDLNGQGDCATGGLIAVGGSYSCSITAWIDGDYESGVSHHNVVTANVTDDDGTTDTDSDDETVTFTDAMASIDVEKYVSIDGGLTWEDADSATGPYLLSSGAAPRFKFVVTNTGNADLTDVDVTDNVFGNISLDGTLAVGASAEYFVTGTWATGQHTNTATATGSFVDGAGNTESDTDTDDANYFGASPSFTVAKECASIQPIPQEGPAKFTVTLENTGNVTISITADEDLFDGVDTIPAGTAFNLAVGYTKSFEVTLAGAFVGLPSADNLVSAEYTYTDSAGNARTGGGSDFAFCRVGSRVNVLKLTQGVVDPTLTWSFSLWAGADGFEGTLIATSSTNGDLDGILDFGNPNLDKNLSYTLCENEVNAGWTSFWQVDTNKDGIVDSTVIPYNPNQSDDPPADIGNRCVNFGYGTGVDLLTDGGTLLFQVNNTYPGGDPRTPGYWKNWNRVTGGGQQYTADANGGWAAGFWLLEDVLDPNIGGGITWDDILADGFVFQITNAKVAVDILDQRDVADPDQVFDGPKMSSDAAYTLAMHLLAAQLNFGSGARTCDAAWDAALAGEELLDKYDFQGTGSYLPNNSKDKTIKADYAKAIGIANTLDLYNNGDLCTGPMVSFEEPLDNDVVSGAAVDLVVNVIDMVPVMQVEFFVDEASIGVDSNSSDGWSMIWDSTTVTDGSHTLRAVATNGAAQTGSADVTITVDNVDDPPVVNITNPSDGAKLSGSSVSITADAYDAGGVTYVEFFVEGASIGIDYDDSDGWSATWDLTGVADGTYTLSATATDNGGMTADHSITVTVDNVPDPKVKVASLTPSSAWTNPVTWQATVEITIDPALAGAEVTAVWNGTVTASCTTGGDGTCSIKLSNLSKKLGSVTFNVTNITLAGYEFDPSGPITVTVNKP